MGMDSVFSPKLPVARTIASATEGFDGSILPDPCYRLVTVPWRFGEMKESPFAGVNHGFPINSFRPSMTCLSSDG